MLSYKKAEDLEFTHGGRDMQAFFTGLLAAAIPILLSLGRIVMAVLAIWIIIRCTRSLFEPQEQEHWGVMTLANGARYDLCHWENVIGRAKNADVRVNFPSVSRSHAAVCRDDGGDWTLYPLQSRNGILLNGQRVDGPVPLERGDVIAVGGVELYFFPAGTQEEAALAEQRAKAGRAVSAAATLWLLTGFQGLALVQLLPSFTAENYLPILVGFGGLCAAMWLLYAVYRLWKRTAYELETLSFLLTTIGFAIAAAYAPSTLYKELAAVVLGLVIFLMLSVALRSLPLAVRLRWPAAIAGGWLLVFTLLLGQRIFGAKNWIAIGPLTVQPSELVKLVFVLVGAATLDRLFARRNLIFTALFSAFCVGCLALMSDFGTALVFFVAFLCIAFLRTGDLPSVVMLTAAAGIAGGIVLHFKPYIADRFSVWRHAWEFTQTTGYQQSRTMSAIASGGLFGTGPQDGWLKHLGAANTDLVFGVVGEEFGLLPALCMAAVPVLFVVFTVRAAANARSAFYTIASSAAAAMLITQTLLNVLGSVDLLPLTGVTFPFVSMGGSSMLACWGLLAYLKAADTRRNASFTLRLPKRNTGTADEAAPEDGAADEPQAEASPLPEQTAEHAPTFFDNIEGLNVDDIFGKEDHRS